MGTRITLPRPHGKRLRPDVLRRRCALAAGTVVLCGGALLLRGPQPQHAGVAAAARLIPASRRKAVRPSTGNSAERARMAALSQKLSALARQAPAGGAAVYVEDIQTGLTAAVHPGQPFLAASLIKVPVMAAVYDLWQRHPELKTPRTRLWMEQMITISDNASTDRLIDLVGGPEQVTRFCAAHGWRSLAVRHAILNHRGRGGTNLCTAREMTEMLVALDRRRLVNATADNEMWGVLLRQHKRARIPAGVPSLAGVLVGNKTGTIGSALHDAGIVHTPRGRYALCILLSHQRSDAAGERFCRQVSRTVFDAMYGSSGLEVAENHRL